MTGVKAPAAVLGASVVVTHAKTPHHVATIGTQVAQKTLPFTGLALSAYLAIAVLLIASGFVLRATGRNEA